MREPQIGDQVLVACGPSKLIGIIEEINYPRYSETWLILNQEKNSTWIKMKDISVISIKSESVAEKKERVEEFARETQIDNLVPEDQTDYQDFLRKLNLNKLLETKEKQEKELIKDTLLKKELREPNDYYQNPSFLSGIKDSSGE